MNHPAISGIFNVGTGRCQSFNDVALSVINKFRAEQGELPMTLEKAVKQGVIEYMPMPAALHGKYQSFTEANLDRLRKAGYTQEFLTVEQGVDRYMNALSDQI